MFKDRKRGRALPPNGWIGENKALKKRQVKNVIKTRGKNAWPYLVPLLNQLNDHERSKKIKSLAWHICAVWRNIVHV